MEKNKAYKALETIGWGRYNSKVYLICGMVIFSKAWFSYDGWCTNITYTLLGIKEEWNVPNLLLGLIASFFQLGLLFGNLTWGILSDKYGRKIPYRLSAFLAFIASVCLTFSVHPFMVAGSFFILGFSMAGEVSLTSSVVCEFCPPTKRYLLTLLSLFFSFGALTSSIIALVVQQLNNSGVYSWRLIVGALSLIQLINSITRLWISETPAYLYGIKKTKEAEEILNTISLANNNTKFTLTSLDSVLTQYNQMGAETSCNSVLTEFEENPSMKEILNKLFGKKLRRTTILLALIFALGAFSYVGIVNFILEFLDFLPTFQAYLILVILQAVGIPGVLLGTWLVETRFGRRWTGVIGLGLAGVFSFVFFFSQNLYFVIATTSFIYLNMYLGFAASFTIGPESFPTQVRSAGYGLINIFGRLGGTFAPIISGALLEVDNGLFIVLTIFSISFIASGLLILMLKETRIKVKDEFKTHGSLLSTH